MFSTLHHIKDAHKDTIWTVAWKSDSAIVTGSVDHQAHIFDVVMQQRIASLSPHQLGVVSVAVHPIANHIVATSTLEGIVRIFDTTSNTLVTSFDGGVSNTWTVRFSSDGKQLLTGGQNGMLHVFSLDNHQLEKVTDHETQGKFTLALDIKGNRVVTGHEQGGLFVFHQEDASRSLMQKLEGHALNVRSVSLSDDASMFCSGSDDHHVNVYDAQYPSWRMSMSGHASWVMAVAVAPHKSSDGTYRIASGSMDSRVKIWDISRNECVHTFTAHNDGVYAIAFNSQGDRLVSVGDDKMIHVHSCPT